MSAHDAGPAGLAPDRPPAADAAAGPGSPERRRVSFRTSGLAVELKISGAGPARRLDGQLIPRQPAVVQIRYEAGVITVEADALGRFSADALPLGQASLRCHLGTGRSRGSVVTGWVTV